VLFASMPELRTRFKGYLLSLPKRPRIIVRIIVFGAGVGIITYVLYRYFPCGLIANVVGILFTLFVDKVRNLIFGTSSGETKEIINVVKGEAKGIINVVEDMAVKTEQREEIKNLNNEIIKHRKDIVEKIYSQWFPKPSQSFTGIDDHYEIRVPPFAMASMGYFKDKQWKRLELNEPTDTNKKLVEYAITHLTFYTEWALWKNSKTGVEKNLNGVKELWEYIIESLKNKVSELNKVSDPSLELVEWCGSGNQPDNYYNVELTFLHIWDYVKNGNPMPDLVCKQDGKYYKVNDYARSLSEEVIINYIDILRSIERDSTVKKPAKLIREEHDIIESSLKEFEEFLTQLKTNVIENNEPLEGTCGRCKPLIEEIDSLNDKQE